MSPSLRNLFLVTHRWIGLGAAIVLVVAGITGAILVFRESAGLTYFHTHLGIDEPGEWLVNTATILAILLVIGGVVLWWRRKSVRIDRSKGPWRFFFDLHHALGIIGALLMLVIAVSGSALMMTEDIEHRRELPATDPNYPTADQLELREMIEAAHTGGEFGLPLKVLWALGSLSFVVQAVSGFWIWWKPSKGAP